MATNGCYGTIIREFIKNNIHNISLSFDGPAYIQNFHRPFSNGRPSFDFVFDTARYFYQNKVNFGIRATISDYSIEYLRDIVDFFVANFPNSSLAIEHLTPHGRALKDDYLKSPDKRNLSEKLIMLFEYIKDKPITIANSASAEYHTIRPIFCTAVGIPNWTVSVDGAIVACARDNAPKEFILGKVDINKRLILIDNIKVDALKKMNVLNYEECRDCFAKYHCAGDCPDRRLSDRSDCYSIRMVGKALLNNKINS